MFAADASLRASDVLVVTPRLADAAPLKYNAMKIEMAKGLLASALEKFQT